jgi:metal-responsive CopG/Arc/MetJ family transcriptional regulator
MWYDDLSYLRRGLAMATTKVAVSIDAELIAQVDRLVAEHVFPNRSKAVQEALRDKLSRLKRTRLARESAKLDRREEQALADEGLDQEHATWPAY